MASGGDESYLDSEEYAAIREAMGGQVGRRGDVALEAVAVALIAEDRAAERAIPDGQKIIERWVPELRHVLGRVFGKDIDFTPGMAQIVDEAGFKRAIANAWLTRIEVPGRRGVGFLAVTGPILEVTAVQRFGGEALVSLARPPSITVLSLFAPIGRALAHSMNEAWKEVQGCLVEFAEDDLAVEKARRALERAKISVVIEIQIKGAVEGVIRLVVAPETLAAPPRQLEAMPVAPGAIEAALGEVRALVQVEMGRTRLPLQGLLALTPGTVLMLDRFVGDPLPIRCAGVLVGQGRAILSRGALAVELTRRE